MKNKVPDFTIQTVPVNAVMRGGHVYLIDRNGRRISSSHLLSNIVGEVSESVITKLSWDYAVRRMLSRCAGRRTAAKMSDWDRKAETLSRSFLMRRRFGAFKAKGRQRFERYKTSDWETACKRVWQQGHNRYRRHSRSGWVRWAHTVSNNHNKRKGGRYAAATYCHGQDDHDLD